MSNKSNHINHEFEKYFLKQTDGIKLFHYYMGISKKEYPKWLGWKLIAKYKEEGIHAKDIEDNNLYLLVRNFFYLQWLSQDSSE